MSDSVTRRRTGVLWACASVKCAERSQVRRLLLQALRYTNSSPLAESSLQRQLSRAMGLIVTSDCSGWCSAERTASGPLMRNFVSYGPV
jgi:hypothetical protein